MPSVVKNFITVGPLRSRFTWKEKLKLSRSLRSTLDIDVQATAFEKIGETEIWLDDGRAPGKALGHQRWRKVLRQRRGGKGKREGKPLHLFPMAPSRSIKVGRGKGRGRDREDREWQMIDDSRPLPFVERTREGGDAPHHHRGPPLFAHHRMWWVLRIYSLFCLSPWPPLETRASDDLQLLGDAVAASSSFFLFPPSTGLGERSSCFGRLALGI